MKKIKFLLVAVSVLAFHSTATSAETDPRFSGLRDMIKNQLKDTPSIAVAVAQNGKIIWEEGFGLANKQKNIAATEHTLYSLASISKPITATGLMLLVKRGLIDLDKPLNDYLGAAKLTAHVGNVKDATVRRIANHTSGLPLHYQFFYDDEDIKRPTMDESIRRYGHLTTKPGEINQYSNFGFGLLDHIIARVSGRSYGDFIRDEVFLPLGMTHSSAVRPTGFDTDLIAERYASNGEAIPFYTFDHPGASASYVSAHDLVRFGMFFLKNHLPDQKAIMSDHDIDDMLRITSKNDSGGVGVAWWTGEREGHKTFGHSGGMGGVSTRLTMVPDENIAIAVLVNSRSQLTGRITDAVIKILTASNAKIQSLINSKNLIPYKGKWQGKITTYENTIPVVINVKGNDDVTIRIADDKAQKVSPRINEDGFLTIHDIKGTVNTSDSARYPHRLSLTLKKRGSKLNGNVSVSSKRMEDRAGNAQSYWTELKLIQ